MTLIEQRANRGKCPCVGCEGYGVCNAKMREMCPACVRWLNYREVAYQEHLRWMEEHVSWSAKYAAHGAFMYGNEESEK